jgi:DNA-binding CsgD family transcriptional regulator
MHWHLAPSQSVLIGAPSRWQEVARQRQLGAVPEPRDLAAHLPGDLSHQVAALGHRVATIERMLAIPATFDHVRPSSPVHGPIPVADQLIAAKVLGEVATVPLTDPSVVGPARSMVTSLTRREHDVLQLLVDGLSNEQIAHRLFLSEATVKKHLGRVMAKWHLKNRVQLAVHGVREGLVS